MSAEKFLEHLAATGLLDDSVLTKLRDKVAKSKKAVTIETLVKVLMDQGHLTRFQATKLVSDYSSGLKSEAKTDPSLRAPQPTSGAAKNQELGFAPDDSLEDHPSLRGLQKTAAGASDPSAGDDDIVELEDASTVASPSVPASLPDLGTRPAAPQQDLLDDQPVAATGAPLSSDLSTDSTEAPLQTTPGQPLQLPEAARSQWDTKLILGGSLTLGFLVIAAFFLYFILRSGSAAEIFEKAEADYQSGAYQNAIENYKVFVKKYPRHENANLAWVRWKMAELHAVAGSPQAAMKKALQELPELKGQPAFNEARTELARLLPRIAEGFADQAINATDMEKKAALIANAEKAMSELVQKAAYIPTKLRSEAAVQAHLKRIQEKIRTVNRNVDRENELLATVKTIQRLTDESQTTKAFEERRSLIERYPGLAEDSRLIKTVKLISKKEAELVRVLDQAIEPLTEEEGSTDLQVKIVFTRTGKEIPGVAGHVCCVLAGGAVYGVDVSTGEVRWRRFVGAETSIHPQRVSDQPGADALLVDSKRQELIRVNSQTGKLVWRLPVGEPFLNPVLYEDLVFVNTRDGKMLEIELQTGKTIRVVKFPMKIGTAVSYDDERPLLYQVGDHDNLYVVDRETMECLEVLYVGHKEGSIRVPPVYAVGFLVLIENIRSDRSILHLLAMDKKGRELSEIQRIRLDGNVVVSPQVFERRLLVATDLGAIHVYDVDPNIKPPLQVLADSGASSTKSFINYPIVYRGQVWMAGQTLAKYRVQPALSKLNRIWIHDDGDTFVAPLQRVEDVLIHARRRRDADAITISGQPVDSEVPFWQTDLGAPTKVSLDRRNNRLRAVSAQAGYFPISSNLSSENIIQRPTLVSQQDQKLAFDQLVEFSNGRLAVTGPHQQNQVLVVDPAAEQEDPRLVTLQPYGTKSGSAVAFRDGLLVPFGEGMIRLFDLKDGQESVMPFQPALRPGDQKVWSVPVIDQQQPEEFMVLENGQTLYRVGVKDQPQPHLTALQQRTLEQPVFGPLAALGDSLFTVTREADHDVVVSLQIPSFEDDHKWPLQGRVVWGPVRVNDRVFVVSDREGLLCFDNEWAWWRTAGVLRWHAKLPYGHLAGLPVRQNESYVLASTGGTVWRIDRRTGKQVGQIQPVRLKKPLWGNPVAHDGQLWLSGIDGVLYVIPLPPAT